jgi:hypothetical protein
MPFGWKEKFFVKNSFNEFQFFNGLPFLNRLFEMIGCRLILFEMAVKHCFIKPDTTSNNLKPC